MAKRTAHPWIESPVTRVHKLSRGANGRPTEDWREDWVATEAPLEVRIGGKPATVLMRTPGHDEELVRGFLFSEGVIASPDDILSIGAPRLAADESGSVIEVELASSKKARTVDRLFYSNSSCGVCGKKTIASLEVRGRIAPDGPRVRRSILGTLPDRLRSAQPAFAQTGGVHASALFTPDGELIAVREDVGRHNALDKLIGWALAARESRLPESVLLVSGRVSYELVQKAVAASIPFIAAVGAPSSLAVELAERFRLTLVGFLRASSMNVYAHPERIVGEEL